MRKSLISRAVAVALLLANVGIFPLNLQAFAAPEKIKVSLILIDEQSRQRYCNGSFIETTMDFKDFGKRDKKKGYQYIYDPCVLKVISNNPLSGNMFLQIKQGSDWVDICSLDFWAAILSKRDCRNKINAKRNLGKVFSSNWTCIFPSECAQTIDYSTPRPYVGGKKDEGDFCFNPAIRDAEFRVRVTSGIKQFESNSVKISYLNADKVIVTGGRCVLSTSPSSSGTSSGQGSTSGKTGTSLPQCSVTQIRQHANLAKSFNQYRSWFLDAIVLRNESIDGMNKASVRGDRTAYDGWAKNLVDSTALARSTANEAIDTQNRLVSLMQECNFNFGIVVTEPYGFIITDENSRGFQFPTFRFP